MPNFTFNPQDVQAITMVLTSMVKDKVPLEMREKHEGSYRRTAVD